MPKPLEVLTAKDVETLVLSYAPAMEPTRLRNIVSTIMGIAKLHGVMVVKADADDHRLHLKYLTRITWTP